MAQIKSTSVVQTPPVIIDPQFFVPDDVIDVRAATEEELLSNDPYANDTDDYDPLVVTVDDPNQPISDPYDPTAGNSGIQPPQWLSVISQTVRIAPDGRTVVDVVVDLEDVLGATDYEVRVTTAG